MKALLALLFLLLSVVLYAQEAYILTNDGEKIVIDAGEYSYDTGKKIKYYTGNAIFPKAIKTADVKEIIDGKSVYKVYAFDEKKKEHHLYKIVATAHDKTLLIRFIEPPANASSGSLGATYYIVDGTMSVLASGEVSILSGRKRSEQEKMAAEIIKSHFGNCTTLVKNLGCGTAIQPDGTGKAFTNNIPMGFKVQRGMHHCN